MVLAALTISFVPLLFRSSQVEGYGPKGRWGLKDDYPMVASSYAAQRSDLAKKIGLNLKPEPAKPVKAPRKRTTRKPAAKKR